MSGVPTRARPFVFFVCAAGALCLLGGIVPWHSSHSLLFLSYLLLTIAASLLKSVLPGFDGTVSVVFVFFLVGICNMTLSETMVLAAVATVVQCFWHARNRLSFIHFAFNLAQLALAITASYWTYILLFSHVFRSKAPLPLLVAAIVFFLFNSFPVATVVALAENISIIEKWDRSYSWTFPYYLIGAAIAGLIQFVNRLAGWEMSFLVLPAVYVIYRSYCMHLGRWEDEKRHLEDLASLNMRTIETLALAIEAKDHTTGDHLQRVRVYAMELGKDLGLSPSEMQALQAASVLHDIGKLAVPESIISKPGKLTPEEFEKMKIHPIVGAEIVEQVRFPYPVAPIVHSHHEKWDGSGYPDGISGEAIPIGARILSAVDCLDALASDRQYRRALPLDEAMAHVVRESGKAFDPRVVAALQSRYVELEHLARSQSPEERPKLSLDVRVERGAAPDAGFAPSVIVSSPSQAGPSLIDVLSRAEEPLTLDETLSTAALRLRHLVPFDALAVFVVRGDFLLTRFALGENVRQLSSLRIRSGQGLAGWVAETGNYIINGNPKVEPGLEGLRSFALCSALAIPLSHAGRTIGVLSAYGLQPDAFTSEHLNVLQANGHQLGAVIAEKLEAEQLQRSSRTPDWRHRSSHTRRSSSEDIRSSLPSVLSSAK
ncbi:MAG: diguanylate cyclase and metal dependent phosphohydrolase [Candidatus Angelobacter sp.]|nr:diguanylate cyclase and metal dependent phosphohydrolase [Candidatus Angelobacter sp.]